MFKHKLFFCKPPLELLLEASTPCTFCLSCKPWTKEWVDIFEEKNTETDLYTPITEQKSEWIFLKKKYWNWLVYSDNWGEESRVSRNKVGEDELKPKKIWIEQSRLLSLIFRQHCQLALCDYIWWEGREPLWVLVAWSSPFWLWCSGHCCIQQLKDV